MFAVDFTTALTLSHRMIANAGATIHRHHGALVFQDRLEKWEGIRFPLGEVTVALPIHLGLL